MYIFSFPCFSLSLQEYIFSFAPKSFPCFRCCFPFNLHRMLKREMKSLRRRRKDGRMPEELKFRHRLEQLNETESRGHDSLYVSPSVACTNMFVSNSGTFFCFLMYLYFIHYRLRKMPPTSKQSSWDPIQKPATKQDVQTTLKN